MNDWTARVRATAIHLGISLIIAALAALLVFGFWYPYPYREISGGRELFFLVVSVDVVLGPLITLVVFNRAKPSFVLRRDFVVIGLLQLSALAYGLWTVSIARPVHLVFEVDRFRPVHAVEIDPASLHQAPAGLRRLPLTGPTLIAVRPFRNENERAQSILMEMRGVSLGIRPELWMEYAQAQQAVRAQSRPVATLKSRKPGQTAAIDAVLAKHGIDPVSASYLPMVARDSFWTVFIDPVNARPVAFMPLDPYD